MTKCRVYWGSHGCDLPRGHGGSHVCSCAVMPSMRGKGNVGAWPYYGPGTRFYGEDAPTESVHRVMEMDG